jgi:hypothetical protein
MQPDKIVLTNEEIFEVQQTRIGKEICALDKRKLELQEELWLNNVSKRVQVNVRNYNIDINTGICVLIKPEPKEAPCPPINSANAPSPT